MLPPILAKTISESLGTSVSSFTSVGGGCINHGGKIVTPTRNYFVKWNDASKFPHMFAAEAAGLALLRDQKVIDVPNVILTDTIGEFQFIVMEWVEGSKKTTTYWQALGNQLAALHRKTANTFGLDRDNYIGSLKQVNPWKNNWIDFFVENRLEVQLRLAINNHRLDDVVIRKFNSLFKKLPDIFPEEKPALLHGDLWSGNLITNGKGEPCLIDPAVYFGNREAEIAFTKLFGGFTEEFYRSYTAHFPLSKGFESRIDVYNLYPLLVHVNLFGGGYASQVNSIVSRFA